MKDAHGRTIDYLRISLTDRCNFRCIYCMPDEGVAQLSHSDILRMEEIERLVAVAAKLGVRKIRLTGGEPLVRKGVVGLVEKISATEGIDNVSITTNGVLLPSMVDDLKAAGLSRVNISLDTLDEEQFKMITRCGQLETTMAGIEAALSAGLDPVKINCVAVKSLNQDFLGFAKMTIDRPLHVRFIEYPGAKGTVGFISPLSRHFCGECNRLRLTAEGKVRPCLFSDEEYDVREALRNGSDADVETVLLAALGAKPDEHHNKVGTERRMSQIGG